MEAESIARKWGDSLGFVIPKEVVEKENIQPNSRVKFQIIKVSDISDTFGKLKRTMSGQEFKDQARAEWEK